jgi:ubiquinol-cytochrome c reductase cytochrome b subunit
MKRLNTNSLLAFIDSHIVSYPTPVNLNYLWSFGSLAGICLCIQIVSGMFLGMHYTANVEYAFNSVEHIMRDVSNGWFIRYIHANGASFFFITVYIHIFRGIFYGSYIERFQLWLVGIIIFIAMMATAFMGYVLPWGQMSFWGATVITNLFSAVPAVGTVIVEWLWGGFSVDNATLNRFFSLHYFLPFIIAALAVIHLALLHENGSTNPSGVDFGGDYIFFYPYFYVKDLFGFLIFLLVFTIFISFYPNALGHSDNYIPANPLVTPAHIVPEWYFLPFYAILRSIPNKLLGVIAMFLAIIILLLLTIISSSIIRVTNYRPVFLPIFWAILFDFTILGWIGQKPVESPFMEIGFFGSFLYFFFLAYLFPCIGLYERSVFFVYLQRSFKNAAYRLK